jgi:hypothetical protein
VKGGDVKITPDRKPSAQAVRKDACRVTLMSAGAGEQRQTRGIRDTPLRITMKIAAPIFGHVPSVALPFGTENEVD